MQANDSGVGAVVVSPSNRDELTGDMYALAVYLLRSATLRTFNAVADLDLSFTQIKVLCALDMDGEERSVKSLADSLNVSLAAMSRAVDGLYERGMVGREEDPADRRMKRVRLTEPGREIPQTLNAGRLSALHDLIDSLADDEADALAGAIAPILAGRPEIAIHRPTEKGLSQ